MGGGFETALSCDIILSADTATFALPEVKVGFFAAAGGVQRLSRYIGRLAAQELVLTGRSITAQEALAMGVVNAVVPKAELLDAAMAKATQITGGVPVGGKSQQTGVKRARQWLRDCQTVWPTAARSSLNLAQTEDFKEGVQAFVEKRKPKWLNR
jgi:crotonobetainyl-CoA hydratase